jgi:hypothetical protein
MFRVSKIIMKTHPNPRRLVSLSTTCITACLLFLPLTTYAKDHNNHHHYPSLQNQWNNLSYHGNNAARAVSGFILTLGNGYAGRGYYYGPPNTTYYNRSPQVTYYATREAAPRAYYVYENPRGNSQSASIQQALAQAGYYRGPIDGMLGPVSRQAIANYQADRGLRVTGNLDANLVNSLGLQ